MLNSSQEIHFGNILWFLSFNSVGENWGIDSSWFHLAADGWLLLFVTDLAVNHGKLQYLSTSASYKFAVYITENSNYSLC